MKKNIVKVFIVFLIVAFLGLFYAYQNGYYRKVQGDKVILTNQKIEEFEKDIKDGKDITIEDYLEEEKDYSTNSTKLSLKISDKIADGIDRVIKFIFQKLGSVVE